MHQGQQPAALPSIVRAWPPWAERDFLLPSSMHQTTQRWFCRIVFVAFCVVPTIAVSSLSIAHVLPSTNAARHDRLEQLLGLRVTTSRLFTPKPEVWRAERLAVLDPETARELATCDFAEHRGGSFLSCGTLSVDAATLEQAAHRCQRWITSNWPGKYCLRGKNFQLSSGGHVTSLGQFELSIATLFDDGKATCRKLSLKIASQGQPIELTVKRDRNTQPIATQVELSTGEATLPANLLGIVSPLFQGVDREASFAGTLTATISPRHAGGEIRGELSHLALDKLLPTGAASGTVTAHFDELVWSDGRVTSARGSLTSQGGNMARDTLASAAKYLYLKPAADFALRSDTHVDFRRMEMRFRLDASGLALWGNCLADTGVRTCMVDTAGRELMGSPQYLSPPNALAMLFAQPGTSKEVRLSARLPHYVPRKQ